ncbi:Zinc finger protein 282 [Mizuhopecten yessoensis]|uniref:Zinc finger protein 282 n=1 Tax=Mizuhopecten yessoensis TaxID=6573 RepID=A0A210Q3M9_MIZYE|nr:Zinc finger protein 282 [Mizuhopecten yessoensis]
MACFIVSEKNIHRSLFGVFVGYEDDKTLGSYVIEGMLESTGHMSRLICESCGIVLDTENEKSKHMSLVHGSDKHVLDSTSEQLQLSGLFCESCNVAFNTENEKVQHMAMVHKSGKNVVATCNICGKTYKSIWGYRYHQKSHQRSFGKTSGSCQCKICGKFFQSRFYLQRHLKSHSTERPHTCQRCGRAYKHSSGLKMHQASCLEQLSPHSATFGH